MSTETGYTVWVRANRKQPWRAFATVATIRGANDLIATVVPNHSEVMTLSADRDPNAEAAVELARERHRRALARRGNCTGPTQRR